jgi:hypothetical protein
MCKLLITVYLYSLCIILMGMSLNDDANLLMHNISWKMITVYTLRTWNMSAWVVALFNFCKLTTNMSIFELIWTYIMVGKLSGISVPTTWAEVSILIWFLIRHPHCLNWVFWTYHPTISVISPISVAFPHHSKHCKSSPR